MREWRNWQTRTFEGRVDFTVRVQVPFLAPTKKEPLSTKTKVLFLNDVCLRQMMTASPNDVRCANDVCLAAHWANIASLRPTGATSF